MLKDIPRVFRKEILRVAGQIESQDNAFIIEIRVVPGFLVYPNDGWASGLREPEGNGVAERFIRTSHGEVQVKGVVLG